MSKNTVTMAENKLAADFSYGKLLKFALPTMVTTLFLSIYSVVDGMFVSRFVHTDALSAINICMPILTLGCGLGLMLGNGGSAYLSKKMGEGKIREACGDYSFLTLSAIGMGLLIVLTGLIFMEPILKFCGASQLLMPYCKVYLRILLCFTPMLVLQMVFQGFLVAVGKPGVSLALGILSGVTNIVLDFIFIVVLDMGIGGAAWATAIGYTIGGFCPLIYGFIRKNPLHFERPILNFKSLWNSCGNGMGTGISNLASGLTALLFNLNMMQLAGEDGVAALSVINYAIFAFSSLCIGFSSGIAPVLGFNYGAQNKVRLRRYFRMGLYTILGLSCLIALIALVFSRQAVGIFFRPGNVFDAAYYGFRLTIIGFFMYGFGNYSYTVFTALSQGRIALLLSSLQSLIFVVLCIMILPGILGITGLWLSTPVAYTMVVPVCIAFLWAKGPELGIFNDNGKGAGYSIKKKRTDVAN